MRNLVQQDLFMVLMDSMVPLRALIEYCLIIFQKEKKNWRKSSGPQGQHGGFWYQSSEIPQPWKPSLKTGSQAWESKMRLSAKFWESPLELLNCGVILCPRDITRLSQQRTSSGQPSPKNERVDGDVALVQKSPLSSRSWGLAGGPASIYLQRTDLTSLEKKREK